jgi:hypothetical protein
MASDQVNAALDILRGDLGIAEFTASTMADYFGIIDSVTSIWRDKIDYIQLHMDSNKDKPPLFPGELAPWFRGVSDEDHDLIPSLARFAKIAFSDPEFRSLLLRQESYKDFQDTHLIEAIEEYLLQRFKTFGSPLIGDKLPESDLSWLFVLRHHAAPSRLLDLSK